ncbi:MAG: LicD family protein [Lachnospiraceae bacterium]|nr:LicD family protein [Lachnospiraceae bacterium]
MKEISLQEMQRLELNILLELDQFCQEHGLVYYMAYGTLLGAVRHKGFVPWDDDIDVWMPRADYDRLIALFHDRQQGTKVPHYQLVAPLDRRSRHSFVKIMDTRTVKRETNFDYATGDLGVDIDVFPLDGQPESEQEYQKWFAVLQKYYWRADLPVRLRQEDPKRRVVLRVIRCLEGKQRRLGVWIKRHYIKKALRLHEKYGYETSRRVGMVEMCFGCENDRFEAEVFGKQTPMKFEGYVLQAPADPHGILRQLYGEYQELPPEEERRGHQIDEVFWKD